MYIDKFGLENSQIRLSEFIIKIDREQIKRNCFESREPQILLRSVFFHFPCGMQKPNLSLFLSFLTRARNS